MLLEYANILPSYRDTTLRPQHLPTVDSIQFPPENVKIDANKAHKSQSCVLENECDDEAISLLSNGAAATTQRGCRKPVPTKQRRESLR